MTKKSLKQKKLQARALLTGLRRLYPAADCTLNYQNPWELLVGAILAAQCTDERVNKVTPSLFAAFPDLVAMAAAAQGDLEELIRSCGLFRNKAKNIRAAAEYILEKFDGIIPRSKSELLEIPGVGGKIANLLLGDAFGEQAVVVDTHCGRVSRLMGLTASNNPTIIERDLEACLPPEAYSEWGHLVVFHGREICKARCRQCLLCALRADCDYGKTRKLDEAAVATTCC